MTTWTEQRIETLKSMWANGESAAAIARALGGVTRNAVIGKLHRLGIGGRAPTAMKTARLAKPAPSIAAAAAKDRGGAPVGRPRQARTRQNAPAEDPKLGTSKPNNSDPRSAKPVHVLDVRSGQCRFPTWSGTPEFSQLVYCGAPVREGSSYCDCHHKRTRQQYPTRQRSKTERSVERDLDLIADARARGGMVFR
ncbi:MULTISPECIES: GcrA family cell cycle regulator [Hyphobacterium]|uniref:GcrA family cell cycle regulator n=1 Tax=Hyphobacterium vulgare TaxID=1736751 RepID=A0ABV6ZU86_9PROT